VKLLFFADAGSVHTVRWVSHFASRDGFEVALASWHSPRGSLEGVRLIDLRSLAGWLAALRFAPDLVHAHYVSTYGLVACLFCMLARVRYVGTVWGSDVRLPRGLWRVLVSFALRRMDVVTCDAQFVAKQLIDLGVSPDRIRVVFFPTDMSKFRPLPRPRPNVVPVVISTRSLEPRYLPSVLVAAAYMLSRGDVCRRSRMYPYEFILLFCGEGSLKESLEEWTQHSLPARAFFVGYVDTADWLPLADVYVSTSPIDAGLSASTAEAMACGLPVVVTRACENEWWVDPRWGVLVGVGDVWGLAKALCGLLRSPARRRRMGALARRVVLRRLSVESCMGKMAVIYRGLA